MQMQLKNLTVREDIVDLSYVAFLKKRGTQLLDELHKERYPDLSFEDFFSNHMGHTSPIAKILTYRLFTTDIFHTLKQSVLEKVFTDVPQSEILLHPIFYFRISHPGAAYPNKYRNTFLDSQPHYDTAFHLHAHSFWLALVDVDENSGGLCYFDDEKTIKLFDQENGKNKYNLDLYQQNKEFLDPYLEKHTVQPTLKTGSVFHFDSKILHGATKPKTKSRISLDFRLIHKNDLQNGTSRTLNIISQFNQSPSYCNALNLITLGDYKGAIPQLDIASKDLNNDKIKNISKVLELRVKQAEQSETYQWQSEYSWIED